MKRWMTILFLFGLKAVSGQEADWGRKLAARAMALWPDSITTRYDRPVRWSYEQGVLLRGMECQWLNTGDPVNFRYIRHIMDHFVEKDGSIRTYSAEEYNIDNINNGRMLLLLAEVTGDRKYFMAASRLRDQLRTHPRTESGGFWHKKIYPSQMWLDGLYMGEPFYAEYAAYSKSDSAWDDIARQFILMEKVSRDSASGLMYHGWDESRQQAWANPKTGQSPNFWARAMGWYGMALADVLEVFPDGHPKRKQLVAILNRYAKAVMAVQDKSSGLWWDLLNYPGRKGNYPEASASSMFVYTLAHAVRRGWISPSFAAVARKGYKGITTHFLRRNSDGSVDLTGTVSVSGLGGKPYRSGSYEYYVGEPVVDNDPKGMGAFIQAAAEMDMLNAASPGTRRTVLLDNYFNNEFRNNLAGVTESYHYTWSDRSNSGFSLLGHLFRFYGAETKTLRSAPDAANLKEASVYIIVDPDTRKETAQPHFIEPGQAEAVCQWVKNGGVLLMLANDSANAELKHFNELSEKFGIHWSDSSGNMVKGDQFETGAISIDAGNPVFAGVGKVYLKEICWLDIRDPARPLLSKDQHVAAAMVPFGKGWVIAVGDPWIYNEYLDGRKLPAEYENYRAARRLVEWLLKKSRANR